MTAPPSWKAFILDDQLATVNGIVTPSKIPTGQKPRRPLEVSGDNGPPGTKICIVCGVATTPERVKDHFVACMHANGNPMGAQWWHNFVDAPKQQVDQSYNRSDQPLAVSRNGRVFRPTSQSSAEIHQNHISNIGLPSASTPLAQAFAIANEAFASTSSTSMPIPPTRKTEAQKSAKPNKETERLAAVNGIVIPSKVAPGNRPHQGKQVNNDSDAQPVNCNICGRGFSSPSHARPHFAVCVGRNGNPYGVRWDDPYSSSNLANFPVQETHYSVPLTFQPARLTPREAGSSSDSVPQIMQQNSHELGGFDLTSRFHRSVLPAPPVMVDGEQAMGVLSNAKLLHMLQAWQAVIERGHEAYARTAAGFQDVMFELTERRLIDGNWTWTVSNDQIDQEYVRL